MAVLLKENTLLVLSLLFILPIVYSGSVYKNKMRGTDYDYIVVGSGSSGAVIASRLSEDENIKVLLLEAGGLPNGLSEIPLLGPNLLGTDLDWKYYSEPQEKACLGLKDRKAFIPRGKVLGGSSTINSMLFVRGDRRDFDEWDKGGATGWSWDDVIHYFKKSEDQTDPDLAQNGYHGVGGPQTISISDYSSPLHDAIFEAGRHLGYESMDLNAESPLGFAEVQGSIRDGRRCSTEKGFLRPAASRDNLDILFNAHVTKVLIDDDRTAHSVRFEQDSVTHVVKAKKEIILSAGVFGSAQILMLSGIGPKEHLEDHGITVIADLPVGQNFQDHVMSGSQVYTLNESIGLLHSRVINHHTIGDFLDGKGPLTIPLGIEALAVANSKYQDPSEKWPDMRFFFLSSLLLPQSEGDDNDKVQFMIDQEGLTVNPMVCRPKSRGFVKLRSADPYEHLIVDPRYLTHEYDIKVLVEGMKFIEDLMQTPAMAKYGPVRTPAIVPGCENMDTKSDDYLECAARSLTITGYHQCCTCKMGSTDDPSTVVDSELRVKGIKGLRVADASIMPDVTSGNTNAPSLMIGEKAADLIKGKYWDSKLKRIVSKNT